MNTFLILNLILIFFIKIIQTTDQIVLNGPKLSIEVRSTSASTIINGLSNSYIKFNAKDEILTITCSKISRVLTGTLFAFVNTNSATKKNCLEFDSTKNQTENQDSRFCLKQQFTYRLDLNSSSSYFEILCRFVETADRLNSVSLVLFKLSNLYYIIILYYITLLYFVYIMFFLIKN
jgi:hypothetical protein